MEKGALIFILYAVRSTFSTTLELRRTSSLLVVSVENWMNRGINIFNGWCSRCQSPSCRKRWKTVKQWTISEMKWPVPTNKDIMVVIA
jgi:hypothetical protein